MSLSAAEEQLRLDLYRQGYNDAAIARQLGYADETIMAWRHRRGLPPNRQHTRTRERLATGTRLAVRRTVRPEPRRVLDPDTHERGAKLLYTLCWLARQTPPGEKLDIERFLKEYRAVEGLIRCP